MADEKVLRIEFRDESPKLLTSGEDEAARRERLFGEAEKRRVAGAEESIQKRILAGSDVPLVAGAATAAGASDDNRVQAQALAAQRRRQRGRAGRLRRGILATRRLVSPESRRKIARRLRGVAAAVRRQTPVGVRIATRESGIGQGVTSVARAAGAGEAIAGAVGVVAGALATPIGIVVAGLTGLAVGTALLNSAFNRLAQEFEVAGNVAGARARQEAELVNERIRSSPRAAPAVIDAQTRMEKELIRIKSQLVEIISPFLLVLLPIVQAILETLRLILLPIQLIAEAVTEILGIARKAWDWIKAKLGLEDADPMDEAEQFLLGVGRFAEGQPEHPFWPHGRPTRKRVGK